MKPTYWTKAPNENFTKPYCGYTTSVEKMKARIEYLAPFTQDAWIQLVEQTDDGCRVVAEYRNHHPRGWVSPLQAAGFAAMP